MPKKAGVPAAAPANWFRRLLRVAVRVLLVAVALSVLSVLLLRWVNPVTSAFMLRRQLEAWGDGEKRFTLQHQWVPLKSIAPAMPMALMAGEDQKFPEHWGFDVEAIADAVEDRLEGKSTRGASTLTQQVAKNLYLWPGQSWVRKAFEVYFTLLIEAFWPKERILEMHLNLAEYGNGVYGVEAASRVNFKKSAAHLSLHESAMLVAVLPNPKVRKVNAPVPSVKRRTGWIVDQAERLGPEAEALAHGWAVKK